MRASDFDYSLSEDLIAQQPSAERTDSNLLVLDRRRRSMEFTRFARLADFLYPGDLLVLNDSRVLPARLRAHKSGCSGNIEVLLIAPIGATHWSVLLRPGKRVRVGTRLCFDSPDESLEAIVAAKHPDGVCHLEFASPCDVVAFAERHGEMPLPPYIRRAAPEAADRDRYQTVFARTPGSSAAPTAGLHFTLELLAQLALRGIRSCTVTLHVGLGTFAPVKAERIEDHTMHAERYSVDAAAAEAITQARKDGRRIVAVGTTSLRVLESVALAHDGNIIATEGQTSLFVHPPAEFKVVNALLTNFHLPRSTLLMLVSAFAAPGLTDGRDWILEAYREAIARRWRFFSYGDAMLIA